jgi:peptidoglycan/LPS O-acetylase OafA/YrhL
VPYRADIDGLRAVAVLSVIAFHAFPKAIAGGFIGVDVFFVISGYLISSLILSGLKNGSFNFLNFYARRARRIFPALIIVLIFVWGLGWLALAPTQFAALSKHIAAGAAFAANIVTYFEVGYFDAPANTKTSAPLMVAWRRRAVLFHLSGADGLGVASQVRKSNFGCDRRCIICT